MKKFQSGKIEIRGNKKKELKEGSTDDGGGGIVVGVVVGGDVVDVFGFARSEDSTQLIRSSFAKMGITNNFSNWEKC